MLRRPTARDDEYDVGFNYGRLLLHSAWLIPCLVVVAIIYPLGLSPATLRNASDGTVQKQKVPLELEKCMIPPKPWTSSSGKEEDLDVNSSPGVTGPGIPQAINKILQETNEPIQEEADTFFAAEAAVGVLENKCVWLAEETSVQDKTCFESVMFDKKRQSFVADPSLIDIVIPSIRNLDFLQSWREFFQGFHIIVIQDGDPSIHLEIPQWVDYELYNRNDIKEALGMDEWIISHKDASIRNFGFLVSKKPFVYTIDDDCLPAKDNNGNTINPIAFHLQNLLAPANPYFFNTLYDPVATGSDYVRGYPYSLRGGVPTAISHGLWLFTPDYDAPTQLLKPDERNSKYLEMVVTIPHKTLYPMCSMNVAFSRELIGPAFMQGLMGEGQPWARYDDMFAGWASKVVADHLGVGVKSGNPYIFHNKLSNPFTNLKKEYKGLDWQEELIRFFANEVHFSAEANTPVKAYIELANQIKVRFLHIHPYFERLGNSMIIWTRIWDQVARGEIKPIPSRQSDDAMKKIPPINLHTTSNAMSNDVLSTMFPTLGKDRDLTVTLDDVSIGHKWKTYLFPLDKKWNEDALLSHIARTSQDCFTKSCNQEIIKSIGQLDDYMAEVIIFKKLLASLHFVKNIKDADLILVPVLGCTVIMDCRNHGRCKNEWFEELRVELEQKSIASKLHLYLSSQDSSQSHPFFAEELSKGNILINLGPGGIVIPSLNSLDVLQPTNWLGCKPVGEREHFLLANFNHRGHLKDRSTILEQLQSYNGTKSVAMENANQDSLFDSVLTLCPPGDLPYQKRFFDSILSCSIPVVIKREAEDVGTTYWSNVIFDNVPMSSVQDSYPSLGFPYSEIVVEVEGFALDSGRLMEDLENIPLEVLESKWRKIREVRERFLFDFNGTVSDAFSSTLESIWHYVSGRMVGDERR